MIHIGKAQLQVTSVLCTVSTTLISSQMMRIVLRIVKEEEVHICPEKLYKGCLTIGTEAMMIQLGEAQLAVASVACQRG